MCCNVFYIIICEVKPERYAENNPPSFGEFLRNFPTSDRYEVMMGGRIVVFNES